MTGLLYPSGIAGWATWGTPGQWVLLNQLAIFDPTHVDVDDVALWEITVTGYARQPVTGPVIVIADPTTEQDRYFGCQNPTWSGLGAGGTIGAAVVIGPAPTNTLLAYWPVEPLTATDVGTVELGFPSLTDPFPTVPAGTGYVHQSFTSS